MFTFHLSLPTRHVRVMNWTLILSNLKLFGYRTPFSLDGWNGKVHNRWIIREQSRDSWDLGLFFLNVRFQLLAISPFFLFGLRCSTLSIVSLFEIQSSSRAVETSTSRVLLRARASTHGHAARDKTGWERSARWVQEWQETMNLPGRSKLTRVTSSSFLLINTEHFAFRKWGSSSLVLDLPGEAQERW